MIGFKDDTGTMIYTGRNPDEYCDSGAEAPLVQSFTKDLTGVAIEATNVAPTGNRRALSYATVMVLRSEGASGGNHGPVTYSWKFTTSSSCPLIQGTWLVGATGTGIKAGLNEATFKPCLTGTTTFGSIPLQKVIVRVQYKNQGVVWDDDGTGRIRNEEDNDVDIGMGGMSSIVRSSCVLKHQCSVCPEGDHLAVNTTSDCESCPASTSNPGGSPSRRFLMGANTLKFHIGEEDHDRKVGRWGRSCMHFSECLPEGCFDERVPAM